MNKTFLVVGIVLAIPAWVLAQGKVKEAQRMKRYQVMNRTVEQMKQITLGMNQYAQDAQGKMPPMQNVAVFQKALRPYCSPSNFISAATGKAFVPNPNLSGKTADKANRLVWCYDVKATALNDKPKTTYRVVGFSNAIIAMPESRWQREKKTSGIR